MTEAERIERGRGAFKAAHAKARDERTGVFAESFQKSVRDAFEAVCAPNWKDPINSTFATGPERLGFILEAITFFTGSVPIFERLGVGETVGTYDYRVKADGYYRTVGV